MKLQPREFYHSREFWRSELGVNHGEIMKRAIKDILALYNVLEDIANLNEADCEKYVKRVDDIISDVLAGKNVALG